MKKRQTKQREDSLLNIADSLAVDSRKSISCVELRDRIHEALKATREETIEECAKELEKYQLQVNGHPYSFAAVAEDIRSLSAKEKRK